MTFTNRCIFFLYSALSRSTKPKSTPPRPAMTVADAFRNEEHEAPGKQLFERFMCQIVISETFNLQRKVYLQIFNLMLCQLSYCHILITHHHFVLLYAAVFLQKSYLKVECANIKVDLPSHFLKNTEKTILSANPRPLCPCGVGFCCLVLTLPQVCKCELGLL